MIAIAADDGCWKGKVVKEDERYEFHADPRTGRLTKVERDQG